MKLGAKDVTALRVGAVNASRAYLGSTLVWEASAPGGEPITFDSEPVTFDGSPLVHGSPSAGQLSLKAGTGAALRPDGNDLILEEN